MAKAKKTSPAHDKNCTCSTCIASLEQTCEFCDAVIPGNHVGDCECRVSRDELVHTAGPWYADLVDLVIYNEGGKIAVVHQQMEPSEDSDITSANACLLAAAPDLLRIAESAEVAFEERISCLRDELLEDFCDVDDINDQIANYQWLLDRHQAVIAEARGRAA